MRLISAKFLLSGSSVLWERNCAKHYSYKKLCAFHETLNGEKLEREKSNSP